MQQEITYNNIRKIPCLGSNQNLQKRAIGLLVLLLILALILPLLRP